MLNQFVFPLEFSPLMCRLNLLSLENVALMQNRIAGIHRILYTTGNLFLFDLWGKGL